jgi:hypothetical protein
MLAAAVILLGWIPVGFATLSPGSVTATLPPGGSVVTEKTVEIPAVIPKADIIFAFDLTGSMGDEISIAKSSAISLMTQIDALVSDAEYGVMSYMDYPHRYTSYHGYSAEYGRAASGDYAYNLDIAPTSDKTAVSTTINSMVLGYGADGPQDYTRIMYESYADPAIGYRAGAKKILIMFGDNVPHDNNLNEGVTSGTWTTGGDPGRDEIAYTSDDLDLQTVLGEMASNEVTLLKVYSGASGSMTYWEYWCALTGGDAVELASASDLVDTVVALIEGEAEFISNLALVAEAGYGPWLSTVPTSYSNIDLSGGAETRVFQETITVPGGTPPGVYAFTVTAKGDGASYGEQLVTITVPGEEPPSTVPLLPLPAAVMFSVAAATMYTVKGLAKRKR